MSEKAAQAFIQEVWGLQGAAYLVVCVRYYQQISTHGLRSISGDDVLMFIATVSMHLPLLHPLILTLN